MKKEVDFSMRYRIGEFNDSFPPMIDGVAQTVKNYASVLHEKYCDVTVVTPAYRGVEDHYPFPVFRYSSIGLGGRVNYRAGNPFSPVTLLELRRKHFDLIHVHAPFASSVLAHNINLRGQIPVVLTYHSRFEIDFEARLSSRALREAATQFILHNINQADEVWTVTKACESSLRTIGYRGECRVMENGTDFAFGAADAGAAAALRRQYGIPDDCLVFLFVGRMMWYKNIRLFLDALRILKRRGLPFRLLMVGGGLDLDEIIRYTQEKGLADEAIFAGTVNDRELLRVYYTLADLFLFPSTYDTCGIVVKEAAACGCPSLLARGSCAAEGAVDGENAFLTEENAADCAEVLWKACATPSVLQTVGARAGQTLYLSWEDAVERAYARYEEILHGN